MSHSLPKARIYLVGGSGGVGKTTIAASLGVHLAMEGRRTLVLTVDPAKRLAQALGFTAFSNSTQKVTLPLEAKGTLDAAMLDAQRDFDRVIERFAKTPEQRDKIFKSKIYRVMVKSLGGTQEYAAMERLLEFSKMEEYDAIVVDTPPSHNAVDLFSAPERLAEFMDTSVLSWFQGSSPKYFGLFRQGTKIAMKALQTIFGAQFLSQLGEVLEDLEGMHTGFKERNLEVLKLVRSEETAFLLVTALSQVRFFETTEFVKTLSKYQIPLRALFLNRIEVPFPSSGKEIEALRPIYDYYNKIVEEQTGWKNRFEETLKDIPVFTLPREHNPIHEVAALHQLSRYFA